MKKTLQMINSRINKKNIIVLFMDKIIQKVSVTNGILYFSDCIFKVVMMNKKVDVLYINKNDNSIKPIVYDTIEEFLKHISVTRLI